MYDMFGMMHFNVEIQILLLFFHMNFIYLGDMDISLPYLHIQELWWYVICND